MDIVAAYLAGFLTPLVILNAWYVTVRVRRGWRETDGLGNRLKRVA